MPRFVDENGIAVTYDVWAAEHPRAVVQLAHGIGEHSGRYTDLIAALTDAGYTVYADDHLGHGRTGLDQWGGDTERLGDLGPGGQDSAIRDLRLLARLARTENPGLPLVLLAHSWGSLMGQILLNEHPRDYDGWVFSGTTYRMPGWMSPLPLNRRFRDEGDKGHEWLSRDPAVHREFAEDPLTFDADVARLLGVRDGLKLFGRPARGLPPDVPVLILVGEEDPLGGRRGAERLAETYRERSGLDDVTCLVYPGARHEVFHETNRDEVTDDLIAWLDGHTPPRSP